MSFRDLAHDRFQAVIEGALRVAAEGVITCDATLACIPSESVPFSRYDRRPRSLWHDELCRQVGANQRHAAVVPGET
jgi:hypothetical protein